MPLVHTLTRNTLYMLATRVHGAERRRTHTFTRSRADESMFRALVFRDLRSPGPAEEEGEERGGVGESRGDRFSFLFLF